LQAKTRTELLDLFNTLDSLRSQQEADTSSILEKLSILDELKMIQDEKKAGELGIKFSETNEDLISRQESENLLVGSLQLHDSTASQVDIVGEPLNEDLMRYGEKGPRHVLIYAEISAHTLVHPFYGVAQRHNRRWAIMKDLRKCPTLADAIKNGQMPSSIPDRIAVAHQIATTVDYLHSVEVLIKRLSDRSVLISRNGDVITPYLTELEKARLVWEASP
jgi:serine/threonine protein kinase